MSNARAARRREKKAGVQNGGTEIQLSNPVAHHFAAFIAGNAAHCDKVVEEKSAVGQHLVLCGAGPSLAEHIDEIAKGDQVWGCNSAAVWLHKNGHKVTHAFTVDQTPHMVEEWYTPIPGIEYLVASSVHPHLIEHLKSKGCDLRWFHNFVGLKRPPVIYGVCDKCGSVMDGAFEQKPDCHETEMIKVHELLDLFLSTWSVQRSFPQEAYNALCAACDAINVHMGMMAYEDWLYNSLYPSTIRAGSGLNSVNRAIDVALCMGFETITLLGADCAIRLKSQPPDAPAESPEYKAWLANETVMHADGGSALAAGATAMTMGGKIDGRHWETKVDMVISAVWLVKAAKQLKGRLRLIGDTLPNALMDKGQDFLDRLPHMCDSEGKPLEINLDNDPVYAGV